MSHFYLTTTLPYVNADPHIGFALEIIQADAVVRYQRLCGREVFFNTGTDEHGLKIYRKAQEAGLEPQAYCDEYAAKFRKLASLLTLDKPTFIRTTDPHHKAAAQEFWKRCEANGDIYKKNYQVKYCVGCELEKTESELVEGKCPIHPTYELELINEENYFFKFSRYQQPLLDYYATNQDFVVPSHRLTEIRAFVERGLEDFSISRLKEKMPWGVPVPGDNEHVMYVWFDALINYISTLNWPHDQESFVKFWGTKEQPNAIQIAGKDNLRQQSAMWQAMLMSAELPPSKQIFIHGFITSEGQKMSKSVGNVVDPYDVVAKYGVDALRYYLLGALPSAEDGDFSMARFEEYYTAHLSNGVGNLTSRILAMLEKYGEGKVPAVDEIVRTDSQSLFDVTSFWSKYDAVFAHYAFDTAVALTQELVSTCDRVINEAKPWEQVKAGKDISVLLYQLAETLRHIGLMLLPIIPQSAQKLLGQLGIDPHAFLVIETEKVWGKIEPGTKIAKEGILFPRLG